MRLKAILVLIFIINMAANAQDVRIKEINGSSLQSITQSIRRLGKDNYDKALLAHDWIAMNIDYDTARFFEGRNTPQDVASVLARRSGVCAGYAGLFHEIMTALGIEDYIVSGWGKGGYSAAKGETNFSVNHDWNLTKAGYSKWDSSEWILLDSTWDAENANVPRRYGIGYGFSSEYFDADAIEFFHSHIPEETWAACLSEELWNRYYHAKTMRPSDFRKAEAFWGDKWHDMSKVTLYTNFKDEILSVQWEGNTCTVKTTGVTTLKTNGVMDWTKRGDKTFTFTAREGNSYEICVEKSGTYWTTFKVVF
jgi:transglutaminase-like putative cysteine protease